MTKETFNKAEEINREIKTLKDELELIPYDFSHYSSNFFKRFFCKEVEYWYEIESRKDRFTLTKEDLQALAKVRLDKIAELEKELGEL
jgi:hypothetical protein